MREITLPAAAKLNLYLDIVGTRPDGYHLLETVMTETTLCDTVRVSLKNGGDTTVSCSDESIPSGSGNICHKAAAMFFAAAKTRGISADIHIEKRIPSGAGLGGGSADAAAVLKALNRLCDGAVSGETLYDIAARVGADVPFCLSGGTKICRGIGEKIEDLAGFPRKHFLILMPSFRCDTRAAYSRYDECPLPPKNALAEFAASGESYPDLMYNVFEVLYNSDTIRDIKQRLLQSGARGASLTGSGAAIFGVFEDEQTAQSAAEGFPDCTAYLSE